MPRPYKGFRLGSSPEHGIAEADERFYTPFLRANTRNALRLATDGRTLTAWRLRSQAASQRRRQDAS